MWCIFIKWFIFSIYYNNVRNRIYLEFGGYFLIKRIKWELIRIKGELSRVREDRKTVSRTVSFWEKKQGKSQERRF